MPHASGHKTVLWASMTVSYPTAWATRLGSTHTHTLSLTCKAVPFIYKRGCALSQKGGLIRRTTDNTRIIPTHSLLALDTLKLHRAHARILSARRSSRHSRPVRLEFDGTSNTPFSFIFVCNPTANFEHLGSGGKSSTD